MADIKISELPVADQANIDDLLEASQVSGPGYVTRHISLDQVATVVADSTQITDLVDDAIGEIPSLTWDNIVDKPTTFPPTVPIAWTDVSGKPTTFPPTIPTGGAIAAWPYLPLTGGTLSGALTGTTATMSGTITTTGGNIITTGGRVLVDRAGDAALGEVSVNVDPSFTGNFNFQTGGVARWIIRKNATVEGGSNAGSDLEIAARNDAGGAIGSALLINRATMATTLGGALTGTTATLSTAIADASNDTTVPTTAWVKRNAGAATSTTATPPASPTDGQMWWNSDASVGGGQLFIRYNDGNTTQWVPASPGVGSGAVVQTVSYQTGAVATGTTVIPNDDTIPQISEGTEFMTLAITPRSATSRLVIEVIGYFAQSSSGDNVTVALFQDAAANALAATGATLGGANYTAAIPLRYTMTSGTTSATTFRVRAGVSGGGTTTFNGQGGARRYGGVMASSIVIQEVL